jgi:hypothetical protein
VPTGVGSRSRPKSFYLNGEVAFPGQVAFRIARFPAIQEELFANLWAVVRFRWLPILFGKSVLYGLLGIEINETRALAGVVA